MKVEKKTLDLSSIWVDEKPLTRVTKACVLLMSIRGGNTPGENGRLDRKVCTNGCVGTLGVFAARFCTFCDDFAASDGEG